MKATWLLGETPNLLARAERNVRDEKAYQDPILWLVSGEGVKDEFEKTFQNSKVFSLGDSEVCAAMPLTEKNLKNLEIISLDLEMNETNLLESIKKMETFWDTEAKNADPFKNVMIVSGGSEEERKWWCSKLAHKTSVPVMETPLKSNEKTKVLLLTTYLTGNFYRMTSWDSEEDSLLAMKEELRSGWLVIPGVRIWQGGFEPEPGSIGKSDWQSLIEPSKLLMLGGSGCIYTLMN